MKSLIPSTAIILFLIAGCDGENSPNVKRARAGIKSLDDAASLYRNKTSRWPDDLKTLTEAPSDSGAPYLSTYALTDPWGRPYGYDPTNLNPNTDHPLIWSEGSSPGQPGNKIVNWEIKDDL